MNVIIMSNSKIRPNLSTKHGSIKFNSVVFFKDRSGKVGRPTRIHYLGRDGTTTLCGKNKNDSWSAAPTKETGNTPICGTCNRALSRIQQQTGAKRF